MPSRTGTAHVVTTTKTYKGKVYRTHLLRRSYREDGKVKNETLGNLSHLPDSLIHIIRRGLQGKTFVEVDQAMECIKMRPHGHVQAVSLAMERLGMASLLGAPSRERDLVLAMVAARIICPNTKLATTRLWDKSTLSQEFCVSDANADHLYAAMDWLIERQDAIEKKLATRHLTAGSMVLYDLSSSYFEGAKCPLAKLGYSRDKKRDLLQVNYGLLTDSRGCPLAVSVHEGNTADCTTFMPAVQRLRERLGAEHLVMVGDRAMITSKAIAQLRQMPGIDWITALRNTSIRALAERGQIQMDLFDERNLFEISSPDYPGERLVLCRNPQLALLRAYKRQALLAATEEKLEKIKKRVEAGRLKNREAIAERVGKVINKFKVSKHFELDIGDHHFNYERMLQNISAEAALDGLYVIRTSIDSEYLDASGCVRKYKSLSQVERAFRSIKTVDLKVRPIHHRTADRVRAHILLCMLAYYVEWHMREAWRELTFADTDQQAKQDRDPVAPAQRSSQAIEKTTRHNRQNSHVHSFGTLMVHLSTLSRNTYRKPGAGPEEPTFDSLVTSDAIQRRALDLIRQMQM